MNTKDWMPIDKGETIRLSLSLLVLSAGWWWRLEWLVTAVLMYSMMSVYITSRPDEENE